MKEVQIIRGESRHSEQINSLIKDVLDGYGLYHLRPAGVDADIADLELQYFGNGGCFWVIIDSELNVIGSCGIFRISDQVCELRKMYLNKNYRGNGLGKLLLQKALDTALKKGYHVVSLKTNGQLIEAASLYLKYGFKIVPIPAEEQKEDCDVAMTLQLIK